MKTRQKSESRIVPQGRGNPSPIDRTEDRLVGKETPVKEEARQLVLSFGTAETPGLCRGAGTGKPADRSAARKKLQGPKTADLHLAPPAIAAMRLRFSKNFVFINVPENTL